MKHKAQFDLLVKPQKSSPSKGPCTFTSYTVIKSHFVSSVSIIIYYRAWKGREGGGGVWEEGAKLVFVPDKRSPLTGGHGGVRVQPQTLCTKEKKWLAKRRE